MTHATGARPAPIAFALLLIFAMGCGQDVPSPAEPEPAATLATAAAGPLLFRQVSAGGDHACGVTTDNLAFCWGSRSGGQLGAGRTDDPEICNTHPCSTTPL